MKIKNKKQLPRDIDTLQDMVLANQNRIQLLEEQIILFVSDPATPPIFSKQPQA